MTARNFQIDPVYCWTLMGYGPLPPRQSRRLIRACNDLWARDSALDEIDRAREGGKHHKWKAETVLLIQETERIAAQYGVDVADGFLFGDADDDGEAHSEILGE